MKVNTYTIKVVHENGMTFIKSGLSRTARIRYESFYSSQSYVISISSHKDPYNETDI